MNIQVNIPDISDEIKRQVRLKTIEYADRIITEELSKINVNEVIIKRIDFLVNKSQYVSDHIIRNLVQQKIAREIKDKILKE